MARNRHAHDWQAYVSRVHQGRPGLDASVSLERHVGTWGDDALAGGVGADLLVGWGGDDAVRGGAGADVAGGGSGSDTFVFAPGDLITARGPQNGAGGRVDLVADFAGVGTSGEGEQDVIRLEGFGAGTTLNIVGVGHNPAVQLYEVVDPTTAGADGFIRVHMADGGTAQLMDDDVVVVPKDGRPALDLVVADPFVDAIDVRLGDGESGFSPPASGGTVPVGGGPQAVALGDLDGDGDLDLVAGNYYSTISVRLNDGAADFFGGSDLPTTGSPADLALGDLNGDAILDLVTANSDDAAHVWLGDGEGGFEEGSAAAVGRGPASIALGDFDGDGDLDLATANNGSNTVSVRLNDGEGGFADGSEVRVGLDPVELVLGDVNGDGVLDLLTANSLEPGTGVSLRLGNGRGGFGRGSEVADSDGGYAQALALGDLDGDGDLDLVTFSSYDGSLNLRLNDGAGHFGGSGRIDALLFDPLALGDVDDDGDLDIVGTSTEGFATTVATLLNDGAAHFSVGSEVAVSDYPFDLALGDLDGPARLTPSGLPDLGPLVPTPAEVDPLLLA